MLLSYLLLGGGASVGSGSQLKLELHKFPSQQQNNKLVLGAYCFEIHFGWFTQSAALRKQP